MQATYRRPIAAGLPTVRPPMIALLATLSDLPGHRLRSSRCVRGRIHLLRSELPAGAWSCNFVSTPPSSRVNSADADSPWPLQKKPESDQAPLDRFRPSSGPPCGPQWGRATTNGALDTAVDSEGYAPRHHSAPSCPRWPTGYIVATAERMTSWWTPLCLNRIASESA